MDTAYVAVAWDRYAGVAPPEGERAKAYVERVLNGVSFIVVRTFGRGRYGRYVADVFVKRGESDAGVVAREGRYLNRVVVERGLGRYI